MSAAPLEDVVSDWLRPGYDITASTIGVFDGDRLVAYADHSGVDVAHSAVHPDYQGRVSAPPWPTGTGPPPVRPERPIEL